MDPTHSLRKWFWNEDFWLPENTTWSDFENPPPGVYYPLERHLLLPSFLIGVLLLGVRYVYERFLAIPFALYMGLKFKKDYSIENNPTLEAVYAKNKYPEQDALIPELAKKTSLTERQVERWFRHRRSRDMTGRMRKFRECSWHFFFYSSSFFCGLYVLWDKPYFWDFQYCWVDFVFQHVPNDVYWYYTLEMGFYWNLMFTLLSDHKRKDFTEMVAHHIITMNLIYFSFATNCIRLGAIVLIVHDSVDFWLAGAKMASYVKREMLTEALFGIFLVKWFITRLYILPFRVIWSATFQSLEMVKFYPLYWPLNALLWFLQVLHIIWTYMILRIVATKFTGNKKLKDVRSDTETSSGGEEEEEERKKHVTFATNAKNSTNGFPVRSRSSYTDTGRA